MGTSIRSSVLPQTYPHRSPHNRWHSSSKNTTKSPVRISARCTSSQFVISCFFLYLCWVFFGITLLRLFPANSCLLKQRVIALLRVKHLVILRSGYALAVRPNPSSSLSVATSAQLGVARVLDNRLSQHILALTRTHSFVHTNVS